MIRGSNPTVGKRHKIPDAVQGKIEQARVARLATLDARRRPHIVPVCFTYDGQFFYTAIDQKPKRVAPERLARLRNIRAVGSPGTELEFAL